MLMNRSNTLNENKLTNGRVVVLKLSSQQTTTKLTHQTNNTNIATSGKIIDYGIQTQVRLRTMSENKSWLQGNQELSPFTDALCVKSKCFLSRFLNTSIDKLSYFMSCCIK